MAVTAQVIATQSHLISLLVRYDGGFAPGTTLDITNAQLAAAAPPGEFRQFLLTDWAANNQANARLRLLGQAAPAVLGGMAPDLDAVDHCRCFVRRIALANLLVDAAVDGADADRVMLSLATGGADAGDWQVDLEFQHTIVR